MVVCLKRLPVGVCLTVNFSCQVRVNRHEDMRIVNRIQNSKNEIGILDKIESEFSSISLHTHTPLLYNCTVTEHALTTSFLLVFPTSLIFPFLFLYPDCLPCYVLLSLLPVFLLPWLTRLGYVLIPFFTFAVFF